MAFEMSENVTKKSLENRFRFLYGNLEVFQSSFKLHDFNLRRDGESLVSRERALIILSIRACIRAFLRKLHPGGLRQKTIFEESFVIFDECEYMSP
jgi:hypothetical protein